MTKPKNIFLNLLSAIVLLISMTAIGQTSEVYFWKGGSGSWHDAKNWTSDGQTVTKPPTSENITYIYSAIPIEISFDGNAFAEALTTVGEGQIAFIAGKNSKLEISSSCAFSENTSVEKNIEIELKGEGETNYLNVPLSLKNRVSLISPSAYQDINKSTSSRSACPGFTITPNPTRPTCNGFNNGVASIEAPTDGVGPYSYQWIGGPATRQWTNVGAGTYTVIVFDLGQGMACNTDVFVNEPGPLTVFAMNATPPLCHDGCDGTAMPIVIGGNGGYNLNWSSGETGLNPTELCATFTLNIVDMAGCVYDTAYIFTNEPAEIEIEAVITNVECFGNDNGAINLSTHGGTGALTYAWSGPNGFSATSKDISDLEPGDYTIEVVDDNNCFADATYTISENPLLDATIDEVDNICGGESEGAIQVEPTGGLPPYSYSWSGPNGFTSVNQNITGIESGLYEVTITDQAACVYTEQVLIDEPSEIQIAITPVHILCSGGSTGSAIAEASEGTPSYSYQWSGPNAFSANGSGISNVPAGIYTVTVTDANLCTQQETVEITELDLIEPTFTIGEITCHNGDDGSIQTEINGGSPDYTIAWSGPGGFLSSDFNIFNLQAGIYSATIADQNNCEIIQTVEIVNPDPIILTADITPSSCASSSDGAINLSVSGGEEPYFYEWTGPGGFESNAENLNNRPSGTYILTVTDANACQLSGSFTISAPDPIVAYFITENASCFGQADGSIQVTASEGVEPYSYIWLGPAGFISMDQNISNLAGGSYSLQIIDAIGCTGFFSVPVTQPAKINVTGPVTAVSCFGGSDGAIQSIVNGGTPGYTYSWTGPDGFAATTENISGVPAGVYTLVATDAIGCENSREYTISQPLEILVDATITNVDCAGDGDGEISLGISNGVAPLTYAWTGPNGFTSSDRDISNLPGGTYNVIVTDAQGCSVTHAYDVDESLEITIHAVASDISCFDESNGEISVTVEGGVEPYAYAWTGPNGYVSTQGSIDNLQAGIYDLTLTDAVGCEANINLTIDEPDELVLTLSTFDISCFGAADGSIESDVSGGNPGYSYSWTGPESFVATTEDISGLITGLYSLVVTDNIGCEIEMEYTIVEPLEIMAEATISSVICAGANDGEILIDISNGVSPLTFSWTGPNGFASSDEDISNLSGGIYNLTVTDDNTCSFTQSYQVDESLEIIIVIDTTHISCFGESNGEITTTVHGGIEPYTYSWSGPNGYISTQASIYNLEAGVYELILIDAVGCQVNQIVNIDEPEELVLTLTPQDISCFGSEDGSISANITGGTTPYIISWTGPDGFISSASDIFDLPAGVYDIEISDAHGCTIGGSQNITEPGELEMNVDIVQPGCLINDGSLTANVSGGTVATDYTYSWKNENGIEIGTGMSISNLATGDFTITVTDDNGCEIQQLIELVRISFDVAAEVNSVKCFGGSDGSISITPISGSAPYTYSWTGPNGFIATDSSIENLIIGQYELLIEDAAGCLFNMVYDVESPDEMNVTPTIVHESCIGASNGSISLYITEGTPGYLVSWTGPDGFTGNGLNISDLVPGYYTADITDTNGCTESASFEVEDGQSFTIDLTATSPVCAGEISGSITAEVIEGGTYTYSWIGPNGFTDTNQNIVGLEAGNYEVEVTNELGCSITETIELIMPDSIVIAIDVTPSHCLQSDGSASANVEGGVGALSVRWLDNSGNELATGNDLVGVSSGIYNIEVTDDAGCMITQTLVISDISGSIEAVVTHTVCVGGNEGGIDITIIDGTSPFTYEWSTSGVVFSNDENIESLNAGIYNLLVTDFNGCIYSASFAVLDPDDISVNAEVIDVSCNDTGGAIELEISNAAEPFTIEWVGPNGYTGAGESITGLEIGNYSYSITTADGCLSSGLVQVESVPNMVVSADVKDVLCGGESTGYVDISVSGGASPISYEWSDENGVFSLIQDIADIPAGTYTVIITDANDCSIAEVFEIQENDPLIATYTIVEPDCDLDNGSISVSLSGGVAASDYFISWTDSDGNPLTPSTDLTDLGVGVYVLLVNDDNGCSIDTSIVLSNPNADISVFATHISCPGENDGTVTLTIADVDEPYTVEWIGPNGFVSSEQDLTGLEPGVYEYLIVGANACQYIGTSVINPATPIDLTANIMWTCFQTASGEIELNISEENGAYEFQWSGPDGFSSQSQNITELYAGEYQVEITYSETCSEIFEFTVDESPEITIDVFQTDISCSGENTGAIELTLSDGVEPYTVTWLGPDGFMSQDLTLTNLSSGDYILIVTDEAGCIANLVVTISEPASLEVTESITGVGCSSPGSLGMIELEVSGGSPDYSVSWLGPDGFTSNDFAISNLDPGVYSYTIVDNNACVYTEEIEILEVEPIVLELNVSDISCFGETDGNANVVIEGGLEPYEIIWNDARDSIAYGSAIENLQEGTYSITVIDSAGCTISQSFEIVNPNPITITIEETTDANCNTSNDGSIKIEVSGGTEPYSYFWTNNDGFESNQQNLDSLAPGQYDLHVMDVNGCETGMSVEITYILEISVNAGDDHSICLSDLPLQLFGVGENVDEFSWLDLDGNILSNTFELNFNENTGAGTYSLIFVGANGLCSTHDTIDIALMSNPVVNAGQDLEVFIEEVFTLGGNPTSATGVLYAWSPNPNHAFNTSLSNPSGFLMESTVFIVEVTDENGCVGTDTVFVNVLPDVAITSGFTPNGDGKNDTWVIDNIELFPNNVVHVYNRWGQAVYEQKSYNSGNAWDGTYEGKKLPVGTYYFTIDLKDERFPEPFTGPITIYR